MVEPDEFMVIFEHLAKEKQEIRMINVYKGFPISYPATITAVDRKSIVVKTNPFQIVCIYQNKETFLRNEAFPATVSAGVMRANIGESEAMLTRFKYVSRGIGERRQVRVEPMDLIRGTIKPTEKKLSLIGDLADVSLDGLAILLSPGLQAPSVLREGSRVIVHIQLPIEATPAAHTPLDIVPRSTGAPDRFSGIKKPVSAADFGNDSFVNMPAIYHKDITGSVQKEFTLEGIVVNIVADKSMNKHRIGIRLDSSGTNRSAISQFILQRQTVILNEIRELYHILSQAAKT